MVWLSQPSIFTWSGSPQSLVLDKSRSLNPVRKIGYRLLPGDLFSYVLHMRPAEWPVMAAHTLLGYVLAVGVDGVVWGDSRQSVLLALAIWVLLLNGGTLALNSVFDSDEGDVGYLRAPPTRPKYLLEYSASLIVAGLVLSFSLPVAFRLVYVVCFVLSILYSVPPFRMKAMAGTGWLMGMWGFGAFTPYATFAATGKPLDVVSLLILLAFCPLFAALYPLTRLHQSAEVSGRGDARHAVILGMSRSPQVAFGMTMAAFLMFGIAWFLHDDIGYAWDPGLLGFLALVAALATWLAILVPWLKNYTRLGPAKYLGRSYRALGAWAVTNVAVIFAFAV